MAIQPIDLQTLYTQMDKVSKSVVQQQQGVQLQNAIEQEQQIKKNLLKKDAVENLDKQNEMKGVKDRNESAKNFSNSDNKKEKNQEEKEEKQYEIIKDPGLGKNIDISG